MLTFASTAAALVLALALVELIILPLDALLYAESVDLVPGFAFSFYFDEPTYPEMPVALGLQC